MRTSLVFAALMFVVTACGHSAADSTSAPVAVTAGPATSTLAAAANVATGAELGKLAPEFTLPDTDGRPVHLADYKGKTVVLEWFNPNCPYVNNAHTKGSLVTAAKDHAAQGVVWLGINSGGPGKQGNGVDATRAGKAKFGLEHPILLDEAGTVGHAYGATNTPHIFVIDAKGLLVYQGAVDNSPDGEGESPTGGKLVRYVDETLSDLTAGQPVRTPSTKAYGCSVKYAQH